MTGFGRNRTGPVTSLGTSPLFSVSMDGPFTPPHSGLSHKVESVPYKLSLLTLGDTAVRIGKRASVEGDRDRIQPSSAEGWKLKVPESRDPTRGLRP